MSPLAGRAQELRGHETGVLVGHAGDEIQHPQIGDVQVILTARRMPAHELQGLLFLVGEPSGIADAAMAGRDERIQQALVDAVGTDLQRRLVAVLEDAFVEDLFGTGHVGPYVFRGHVHERAFAFPAHDALVLGGEGLEQARGHMADDAGPHIPGPLPVGAHIFQPLRIEFQAGGQRLHHLQDVRQRDDVQLAGVFHVHDAVAGIVGRFGQQGKRMPGKVAPARLQAQGAEHILEDGGLGLIVVELALAATRTGLPGIPGIFDHAGQRGIGEPEPALIAVVLHHVDHPEALGVAVEATEVALLRLLQRVHIDVVGRIPEPVADGELARMAERRIADIVGQAGGLQDLAGEFRRGIIRQLAPAAQKIACHGAQRTPHAADFQRMAETRVDMVVTHQRMHLRLPGQTPERTGIDDAVPVLQKRAAGRVQLFEIHTAAPVAQGKEQFAPLFLKIHGTSRVPETMKACQYVRICHARMRKTRAPARGGRVPLS